MLTISDIKMELKEFGVKGITGKKKAELKAMLDHAKAPKDGKRRRGLGLFQSRAQVTPAPTPETVRAAASLRRRTMSVLKALPFEAKLKRLERDIEDLNVDNGDIDLYTMKLNRRYEDPITREEILVGDYVIDFNNELDTYKRTMRFETFLDWIEGAIKRGVEPRNPYNREPIDWNTVRIIKFTSANPRRGILRRIGRGEAAD